jgi:hypothetical protein
VNLSIRFPKPPERIRLQKNLSRELIFLKTKLVKTAKIKYIHIKDTSNVKISPVFNEGSFNKLNAPPKFFINVKFTIE